MPKRSHVLIVDDDVHVLGLFMRTLIRENYVVTGTTSGVDALDLTRHFCPNVVVLDLSMPEPDGFETLKRLHSKSPELKVVVVSGAVRGTILNAATLFGAAAALEKPVTPDLLVRTLHQVLARDTGDELFRSSSKVG